MLVPSGRLARQAIAAAVLAACAPRPEPEPDPSVLVAADRALARAVRERGLEGWVAGFAEDGVVLDEHRVVGPGATVLRAWALPAFQDPATRVHWDPVMARVVSSEGLGYTVGEYRAGSGSGRPYVNIWRRDRSGTWQVVLSTLVPLLQPEQQRP